MNRLPVWLKVILLPAHLRRTGTVALVVGAWLTAFNEGDVLISGIWNQHLAIKIALNLLTPFVVANLGLLSHQNSEEDAGDTGD
ncbi:MAG: hypothetical protein KGJ55_05740 [Gammaproteobacteria bacterium]|nr:hypothetical protein [Gammaproteobacteria bacterium]